MPAPKDNKFALGNNGGAPSKYDAKYCQEIIDYFSVEPMREVEIPHYGKDGGISWTDTKQVANPLPKLHEFARKIGVTQKTLHNWCDEHEEFLQAFTYAKELQKWFLIENGLNGCYNPSAYIFTAKNISDMRDKTETEHSGELKVTPITGMVIK